MMLLANEYISCGGMQFPSAIANFTRIAYAALMIITPIILIIMGSVDMVKAVSSGDESSIKKAQGMLGKRLKSGAIVFLILSITAFAISFVADNTDDKSYSKCLECLTVKEENCDRVISIGEDNSLPQGEEYGTK